MFLEGLGLKKVKISINLGIIGVEDSRKEIFHSYLEHFSLKSTHSNNQNEYIILHQDIPFKIRLILSDSLETLINKQHEVQKLDVLMICINIYDSHSINLYIPSNLNRFIEKYKFQGITMLVGIDTYYIEKGVPSEYFRISRLNLIKKTNQLNFIYCFEIQNKDGDIRAILKQIFDDILLKFQSSNPEILEKAKLYGKLLSKIEYNQSY